MAERKIGLIAALMDASELLPLIEVPASRQCDARASPHLLVRPGSDAHCSAHAMAKAILRDALLNGMQRLQELAGIVWRS
jgi:hypothetical protein